MFSGIDMIQLPLTDNAMMLAHSISAIFYHDQKQEIVEKSKRDLEKADVYKNAIVTASQEEKDGIQRLRAVFHILL